MAYQRGKQGYRLFPSDICTWQRQAGDKGTGRRGQAPNRYNWMRPPLPNNPIIAQTAFLVPADTPANGTVAHTNRCETGQGPARTLRQDPWRKQGLAFETRVPDYIDEEFIFSESRDKL
jgi:hypothetical protein